MDENHTVSAVAMQFALACNLCTLVYFTALCNGEPTGYFPLALLVYAPAVYGLDRLFLRQTRTMQQLLLLNAALGICLFVSACLVDGWGSWWSMLFIGIFCLWPAVQGGTLALEPPDLHKAILCLDISAVDLVLFVGFLTSTDRPVYWCVPMAAGCAAAILGVIFRRINRSMGPRDWGILLLAFGAILAIMLLVVGFVAAPAGQGVVALWHGLVALARFLLALLWQFLIFLSDLFPAPEAGELPPEDNTGLLMQEQAMPEGNPYVVIAAAVIGLALLMFFLAWLLHRLGKLRIGGKRSLRSSGGKERRLRLSLLEAIRRALSALAARMRLSAFLRRERNTPVGIYFLLTRRCRLGPWHKRAEETPREFLTRLRESAGDDRALAAALDTLIPAVDSAFYAPVSDGRDLPEARLIRRKAGAAVRRRFLRDCWENVRTLMKDSGGGRTVETSGQ